MRENPKIIIEAKGYEATGSKLTDVLGDILKVLEVKDESTHYFFVTDGIGWYRRISDLKI
ncbi:MAG: DpnII family type II restriction endonuclease [Methanotrichaceae archaeon]